MFFQFLLIILILPLLIKFVCNVISILIYRMSHVFLALLLTLHLVFCERDF